jgi:cyclophilin family peptidyl-prolyl cis-trans isomerase
MYRNSSSKGFFNSSIIDIEENKQNRTSSVLNLLPLKKTNTFNQKSNANNRNSLMCIFLIFMIIFGFIMFIVPPEVDQTKLNKIDELVTNLIDSKQNSPRNLDSNGNNLSDRTVNQKGISLENQVNDSKSTIKRFSNDENLKIGIPSSDNHHFHNSNNNNANFTGCLKEIPIDTKKHIVSPPDGPVTLVCCQSTKGPFSIAVHPTWAPNGAQRFLDLVKENFFSTKIGLFRALKGFLIQFGLSGDPKVQEEWNTRGHLPDDVSWLPLGPTNREIDGVKRFQKGYMAYAGAGKNSRGTQLILAFEDNLFLGSLQFDFFFFSFNQK